jgi:hypothetical protein
VVDTAWYVLVARLVSRRLQRRTGLVLLGLGARLAVEHR